MGIDKHGSHILDELSTAKNIRIIAPNQSVLENKIIEEENKQAKDLYSPYFNLHVSNMEWVMNPTFYGKS